MELRFQNKKTIVKIKSNFTAADSKISAHLICDPSSIPKLEETNQIFNLIK